MKKFNIISVHARYTRGVDDKERPNNFNLDYINALHMDLELMDTNLHKDGEGDYIIKFKDGGKVEVRMKLSTSDATKTYYYLDILKDSEFAQRYVAARAKFFNLMSKYLIDRYPHDQNRLACTYVLETEEYGRIETYVFPG